MPKIRTSAQHPEKAYLPVDCLFYTSPDGVRHEGGTCEIPLCRGAAKEGAAMRWGWDGNAEQPTITPSYQCQRCGLHVTITNGVEGGRPA